MHDSFCHLNALVQGLAFVGSEVITFNAVTNSFLQSEWLAALFQVRVPITSKVEGMQSHIH